MRILHVAAPGGIGGLERVVQMLAIAQRAAENDVHIAALLAGAPKAVGDRFFAPLEAAGVGTHSLEMHARAYLRERAAIIELARRQGVDVIHTHGYRADVVDSGVARRFGYASVTTAH